MRKIKKKSEKRSSLILCMRVFYWFVLFCTLSLRAIDDFLFLVFLSHREGYLEADDKDGEVKMGNSTSV